MGEGCGEGEEGGRIHHRVMEGECRAQWTNTELQCCTPEMYIISQTHLNRINSNGGLSRPTDLCRVLLSLKCEQQVHRPGTIVTNIKLERSHGTLSSHARCRQTLGSPQQLLSASPSTLVLGLFPLPHLLPTLSLLPFSCHRPPGT